MAQDTCVSKEAKSKSFSKSQARHKAWRADGMPARKELGERIGGGWFVFKRNPKSGRISPSKFPFEYADKKLAKDQADVLSALQPGAEFIILQVVATVAAEGRVAA